MESFLLLAFVFLIAGVVSVPIASKLGLGSVLGYLIAGIVIGPILHGLNVDVISLQHFAEFGVVMMLFLVGLELEPRRLWQMRNRLLGLGGLQVGGTAAIVALATMALGQPWSISVAVGLVVALSSTAIVLQTLNEKGLMRSDGGQASFSVLLFQDIAVIPMLALLPLLAMPELMDAGTHGVEHAAPAAHEAESSHGQTDDGHGNDESHGDDGHGESMSLVDDLPGWQAALVTLAAVAAVIFGGSVLTRPIFRFIALARLRELFTAAALMIVIGIALLMTLVGLSPALGTFLAGVVLANSEYRHELESDIDPFKGLLLGLFFMTVGAAIDFGLLFADLGTVLGLTLGLMVIKAGVLFVLALVFRIPSPDRWLFTLGLAQAGEFGFVLLSFTVAQNVIPPDLAATLLLVVALSMLLTPGLFILYDRVIVPRLSAGQELEADEIDEAGTVIIAGHGRFGGIVNRILRGMGHKTVVLDHNSGQLEMLRAFGVKVFYGDASRPDLLHAAGIAEAKLLVVAIDDREQATELVQWVSRDHPNVHIVARAIDRFHVYELFAAGAHDMIRDTFDSSVRAARSAIEALGIHPYDAERQMRRFVRNDRKILREMAQHYDPDVEAHENTEYVSRAKELREIEEAELRGMETPFASRSDRGWVPPTPADVEAETEAASSD